MISVPLHHAKEKRKHVFIAFSFDDIPHGVAWEGQMNMKNLALLFLCYPSLLPLPPFLLLLIFFHLFLAICILVVIPQYHDMQLDNILHCSDSICRLAHVSIPFLVLLELSSWPFRFEFFLEFLKVTCNNHKL